MARALSFAVLFLVLSASGAAAQDAAYPSISVDGYYRVRPLYLKDPNGEPQDVTRLIRHRLRINPTLQINEYVGLHVQVQALDGVWGANPGNVLSQSTEDRSANMILRRAYGEVTTPVGVVRAGRMGSQWGFGILSNDGDGFRNDFGDAEAGDTYDRILFVTKPLGKDGPLTSAVFFDKVLETDGLAATLGPDRVREGDVDQYGVLVHYKRGHFAVGTYSLVRTQTKTDTQAFIPDLLVRYNTRRFHFGAEAVGIFGETAGLTAFFTPGQTVDIRGKPRTYKDITLERPPLAIQMVGAVGEAGFLVRPWLDTALEAGYASGDKSGTDTFSDGTLTSYSFDPDYNVGLILFEYANTIRTQREYDETLARFNEAVEGVTLRDHCLQGCVNKTRFATTAQALDDFLQRTGGIFIPTRGSVRNAVYLHPKVRAKWANGVSAIAAVLWAQANENIVNAAGEVVTDYGLEIDGGAAYQFTPNAQVGLQAGYFMPGAVFAEASGDAAPAMWTVQPRLTVTF
jgi:hypothetical protein